jgi:hypothetical protein
MVVAITEEGWCWFIVTINVTHPQLLNGLNYESKGEDNGKRRSWGTLFGS